MTLIDYILSLLCAIALVCFVMLALTRCTDEPMRPLSSLDMIQADQRCKHLGLQVQFEYRPEGKAVSYSCVRAQ